MPFWSIHRRDRQVPVRLANGQPARDADGKTVYRPEGSAVLASAALVSKEQVRSVVSRKADWQRDAWDLYDTVTELRFGVSWISNACSRARLYVGRIDPDGSSAPVPLDGNPQDGKPADLSVLNALAPLEELSGGQLGQSEMLRRIAIHLNVPGESYLVGFDDPTQDGPETRRWLVCSGDEIQSTGSGARLSSPDMPGEYIDIDPAASTILRIWRPHPRYAHQADSPIIGLRQPLRELVDLSAHITASAESRLAGAGVLFVPDELTTPHPEQSEGVNPLHPDPFTASLIEAMAAPLKNRDSASAVVPLVVRGPAEKGKELKHLSFSTDLDANVQTLRESAIRRVATGMDMPPEILVGLGDSNHWCLPVDAEILTRTGWMTHDQLTLGQQVATLNTATGQQQWQPLEGAQAFPITTEPMLRLLGPGHHSLSTMNHRWPVLRDGQLTMTTSSDLRPEDELITPGEDSGLALVPVSSLSPTTLPYTGTVWCPTTPNGTWLARYRGNVFYTGNSAWQIEESAIKLHIEPLLGLICDSLTTHFLRPALKAMGEQSWSKYAIWYDVTGLTMRPNRAPEAAQALEAGLIGKDAARREMGFAAEDKPSEDESIRSLVTDIVKAAPTLAPSLLPFLGIRIPETAAAAAAAEAATANPAAAGAAPTVRALPAARPGQPPAAPSAPARPAARPGGPGTAQDAPRTPPTRSDLARAMATRPRPQPDTWRTRCLDMAVRRALSRAGQYLLRSTPRAERARLQQMRPDAIHLTLHPDPQAFDQMLANAYTEFHDSTPGETCLHQAVDAYVRALLLAREPHHSDYLDRALAQYGCDTEPAHA